MADLFLNKQNLQNVILSILFVSGDAIEIKDISDKLQLENNVVIKAIDSLKEIYNDDKGIHVITFKNKVQLCSNPEYADYIADVLNPIRERQLSKSALETLAIICYKQPITRLEIEEIRGVSADYAVQLLLQHNLIEVVGRKDAPGKPLLIGTTDEFLKRFELNSINDLPDYNDILDRIEILHKDDNLFDNRTIPEQEPTTDEEIDIIQSTKEEIPEFLQGENDIQVIN